MENVAGGKSDDSLFYNSRSPYTKIYILPVTRAELSTRYASFKAQVQPRLIPQMLKFSPQYDRNRNMFISFVFLATSSVISLALNRGMA